MTRFTVFGASGFIGRHLVAALKDAGHDVATPARGDAIAQGHDYGHVIYAIGLTGDFRQRPHDVVQAHVGLASDILQQAQISSFLYLSSTRVYRGLDAGAIAQEDMPLPLSPSLDSTYDYSKLLGEALCLADARKTVRVARLSNVYGRGMSDALFLGSLIRDVAASGHATINDHPQSAKDYIDIDSATAALIAIAEHGTARCYNVASGVNITNQAIADAMNACGKQADFSGATAEPRIFPIIDTARLRSLVAAQSRNVITDIPSLFT